MICERCHGRGRMVEMTGFGQGQEVPYFTHEIMGVCPDCMGTGVLHCCEGDRAQVMVEVCDKLLEAATDADPNEG